MALTVLSVAFPFAPVGPDAVGGAERILSDIDTALLAAGHRSLVVACEGSKPAGTLFSVPLPHGAALDEADQQWCRKQVQAVLDRALASTPVDVVHMHGLDFYHYTLPPRIPVLVTLHMPIAWYLATAWQRLDARVRFCCVSETQRRSFPAGLQRPALVSNGVPVPELPMAPKDDYAVLMGRICPEKNAHAALEAGTRAGMRVLLGGQVFPYREHQEYFQQRISPLLQKQDAGVRHEFLGPLNIARRQQLLSRAKCLLHPTLAPETSSLVAMEAMAAGTPVIAFRSGALPEIVDNGVTGLLVESVEEMVEAIAKVRAISPESCRTAARQRFASEQMIQGYFALYREMLAAPAAQHYA